MTTKLPDRCFSPAQELPPDPMIDWMRTAANNYLSRVAEASGSGVSASFNPRLLARAALAFESEIRLLSLGRIVDSRGGSQYDYNSTVTLGQGDADVADLTNSMLGIAKTIVTTISWSPDADTSADGVRRYTTTRADLRAAVDAFVAANALKKLAPPA
jgi:hypothetical protein